MMPKPGSYFVVSHSEGWISAGIRLVTRSRYSHAGVVLDDQTVIESEAHGAIISPWSKYASRAGQVALNDDEPLTPETRARIVVEARKLQGVPYNYRAIAALLLVSLGVHFGWLTRRVASLDSLFCSELVDVAYDRAGVHLFTDGRPYQDVTPGDLADRLAERPWAA